MGFLINTYVFVGIRIKYSWETMGRDIKIINAIAPPDYSHIDTDDIVEYHTFHPGRLGGICPMDNGYYFFCGDELCGGDYLYFGVFCQEFHINNRPLPHDTISISIDFPDKDKKSKFKSFCKMNDIPLDSFGTYMVKWYIKDDY